MAIANEKGGDSTNATSSWWVWTGWLQRNAVSGFVYGCAAQYFRPPGWMGECGTSTIVPAVTNVIFAATGKRLRKLPVDTAALKQPA